MISLTIATFLSNGDVWQGSGNYSDERQVFFAPALCDVLL